MARAGWWTWRNRRWAAAGLAGGALAVAGVGCHTTDPAPIPVPQLPAAYSGYKQADPASLPYPVLPAAYTEPKSADLAPARRKLPGTLVDPVAPVSAVAPALRTGGQKCSPLAPRAEKQPLAERADYIRPELLSPPVATGGLHPVPTPPPGDETIDLGIALRLAGVDNPTINLAREQIREALANQLAARSLLLPSINIGGNYHYHSGNLQPSFGGIRPVTSQALYLGFGARTLAAESVAFPGVRLFAHLGDAVYEPLAARQRVSARTSEAAAVQNDILLRVTEAYLELLGAEARLEALRQGEADVGEVVRLTRVYAEKGQGRKGDADRAETHLDLVRWDIRQAEEEVAVASAGLARLLNLDPSLRLRTPGGALPQFRLVPEDSDTEPLVARAVRSRPELVARSAEISEAQVRVRQEQVRPWVPVLSVGYSGGLFGGGGSLVNDKTTPLNGRSDFDVYAVWTMQNLGLGNRAQVRRADAGVGEAVAHYDATINQVRREVSEAQADAKAAARRVEVAKTEITLAGEGYKLEVDRIKEFQGRPIEVLDSFRQLLDARLELVRATVAYDTAQFRLFVALGSNPANSPAAAAGPPPPPIPMPVPKLPAPKP